MKKYITLAALLAAGTVSANASVVLQSPSMDLFNKTTGDEISAVSPSTAYAFKNCDTVEIFLAAETYMPSYDSVAGTFTFDGVNDGLFIRSTGSSFPEVTYGAGTFSIVASGIVANNNAPSVLFTVNNKMGFGITTDGKFCALNGKNIYSSNAWNTPENFDLQSQHTYTMTLGSGGTNFYVDGEFIGFAQGLYWSSDRSYSQMVIGATSKPEGAAQMTLHGLSIYGNSLTTEEVRMAYASGSLIPEPSAFGMLAGVGALALVASRRRRTQKI